MYLLIFFVLSSTLPVLIYIFLIWNFDHWRKRGVNGPKPKPLLGNLPSLLTQRQHIADDINDIYREFKNTDNYVGVYAMRIPQLLILEPGLVHDIFVNGFNYFHDNDVARIVDRQRDPLIANNPFILTGKDWREQRAIITPAFTATRIKLAYKKMQHVCNEFCKFIEEETKISGKNGLNGKDLALRFTCETLADCVLGIEAKSFTDQAVPIAENVKSFAENNSYFMIYQFITGLFPKIVHIYKAKFITAKCEKFFIDLIHAAFEIRTTNQIEAQDFLNYLLSLREKQNLSDIQFASHAMTFLIDGLDTTAAVISHCLLLLARNQAAQMRLRQEILDNCNENGVLSFENLSELEYLDACLHESIRIFPPAHIFTKVCTQPYEFTNKNGNKLKMCVGDTVIIPAHAIHHDAAYYPAPEQFKPERFLKENGDIKNYRDAGMFLGFGNGPRMCIGMRLALVQTKAAVVAVMRHFKVTTNAKTKTNNELDPKQFLTMQNDGVWLDFQRI